MRRSSKNHRYLIMFTIVATLACCDSAFALAAQDVEKKETTKAPKIDIDRELERIETGKVDPPAKPKLADEPPRTRESTSPTLNSRIRDEANLFSEKAVERAESELQDIERKYGTAVVVETVDTLAGESVDALALDHARRSGSQGIYILIAKKEHKISDLLVSRRFLSRIDEAERREVRETFESRFRNKDFDGGLLKAVATIRLVVAKDLDELAKTSEPFNPTRPSEMQRPSIDRESPGREALVLRDQIKLTSAGAKKVLAAAESKALEMKLTMNIAVVDEGGNLIAFLRMDGARPASAATATTKAVSAATYRQATGPMPANAGNPDVHLSLAVENAAAAGGAKVTTLKGGVPIVVDGQLIGAVGVGGGSGEQDQEVAKAGVQAFQTALTAAQAQRANR